MKKNRLSTTIINLKKSVERFPITVLLSTALAVLLIVFYEQSLRFPQPPLDNFIRVMMTVGLSVLLSFCLGLINERFFNKEPIKQALLYVIGLILLIVYYKLFLVHFNFVSISRYIGLAIMLVIASFFIPWIKKGVNFEYYVIKVFSSLLVTIVYSGVLCFGLFAILFTTDQLFDLSINGKFYYYIFLLVSLVFAVAMFLSKIPGKDDGLKDYSYSKSLRVLLLYIVIPLISVYTLILYVYFAKILLTSEWPKGLVSHLVLWYSSISVGVIFLISPLTEDNQVARLFKKSFPKVILPILAMMFVSIGIRINQYGITENRYYVVLLGLWVLGMMIYYAFAKNVRNIVIPITLSIVCFVAVVGPLSGFSVSIRSQNDRFETLLSENDLFVDGSIVKNPSVSREVQKEVNNILNYFASYHEFADMALLPEDFTIEKMESVFGFAYTPYDQFGEPAYINFSLDMSMGSPLNISGYDYYVDVYTWNESKINVGNLEIAYEKDLSMLTIKENDKIYFTQNINDLIYNIYQNNKEDIINKGMTNSVDDMSFVIENEDIKVKLIITNFYGMITNDPNDPIDLESADMILLLKQK